MENNDSNNNRQNSRMKNYHQEKNSKQKKVWFQIIKWFFIVVLLVIVGGVGLFAYYAKDAPSISRDQLESGGSSSLYTNDGKFLLSLGTEKRTYVSNKEIPQQLKDAVVSVEDKRFYHEGLGLDPVRILGSVLVNAKSNSVAAGGSTLTQQLVKLSVFSTAASQRTLKRKAQEAWLSMKVEREYSKNQILEFYINKVFMNYGNYGMGTAANYYYGKNLKQLDLAQTALLAGMPNAPVTYDPYLHPEAAKYRRDVVLKTMLENKKITKTQYEEAKAQPITHGLVPQKNSSNSKLRKVDDPYIKQVLEEVKEKGFNPYDNLKITINIDQDAQQKLYDLANNGQVPFTNDKMQVGATIVDPNNGHVVAILGGRHLPSVQLGLNRAVQTGRSTGSTIKPILDYAPAIQYLNWGTSHMVDDSRYVYPGTNVQLHDWDNKYMGKITMRKALEQSRNVPAVKTLDKVGIDRASLFARNMGINVPSDSGLSIAIGANASSLQMAGAYGAFANNGIYYKPQFVSKIETPDGLTRNYGSSGKRVMKTSTSYIMTDMLKGVFTKGSGTAAKINNLYEAGKTGTVKYSDEDLVKFPQYANSPKDAWFAGYTRSYSMAIWTGYDNLKDGTPSGVGETSAQVLYKYMMQYLMKNKENKDWEQPDTVVRRRIVNGTENKVATSNSNSSWQLFVKGHAPINSDRDDNSHDEEIDTHFSTNSRGSRTESSSDSSSSSSTSQDQNQDKDNKDNGNNSNSSNNSQNQNNTNNSNPSNSQQNQNNSNSGNNSGNNNSSSNNTATNNSPTPAPNH